MNADLTLMWALASVFPQSISGEKQLGGQEDFPGRPTTVADWVRDR